jgi:hypothetical protein
MKFGGRPSVLKFVLTLPLMVGTLVSGPAMMLHGRDQAAQADQHGHHAHHHPAAPGRNDCCEWCLNRCVAPATLPYAPAIPVIQIPAAAEAAIAGPGRQAPVHPVLLPYPLGPPAVLSV